MIKPDMIIATIDGPHRAPNRSITICTIRPSDLAGAWLCEDIDTGQEMIMQEAKLLESLRNIPQGSPEVAAEEPPTTQPNPS